MTLEPTSRFVFSLRSAVLAVVEISILVLVISLTAGANLVA